MFKLITGFERFFCLGPTQIRGDHVRISRVSNSQAVEFCLKNSFACKKSKMVDGDTNISGVTINVSGSSLNMVFFKKNQ